MSAFVFGWKNKQEKEEETRGPDARGKQRGKIVKFRQFNQTSLSEKYLPLNLPRAKLPQINTQAKKKKKRTRLDSNRL